MERNASSSECIRDGRNSACPIARSLNCIGESWSLLILRDAFMGFTRFDEFQKNLGIAPNMLSRRLNAMVDEGLLERRQYLERPLRFEYLLTSRGRDLRPILLTLQAWGNKYLADEGLAMVLIDRTTGMAVETILVDAATGKAITEADHVSAPGPAASERMHQRLFLCQQKTAASDD